ncbi:MAG: alanine--tRNA ligase [Cytophagales bacterium]
METLTIRQRFIDFFKKKNHQHAGSVPVVRKDDPTLLFVNAGMNPFASIFMGDQRATSPRLVNSQPCIRVTGKHNDLDDVGHDTYHHTLFEMMGSWSFGDYFKERAILWAFELLTKVYGLPEDRLYATVFGGDVALGLARDEESFKLWQNYLPKAQILYEGAADNFWEMGKVGVCGPCTELHFDARSEAERQETPGIELVNKGDSRILEIWNLVFIQNLRKADGSLTKLAEQHVDTGLGLERLAMVLQGKTSTYDTDVFQPLIAWVTTRSGHAYGQSPNVDIAIRVIVDHIRTICFAIADGQLPGTQRGGYVVRMILRRALRYGFSYLGLKRPFLYQLAPILIQQLGEVYPRLKGGASLLVETIRQEEDMFLKTLSSGLKRLSILIEEAIPQNKQLNGKDVFELYDTFGFPPDLTRVIATEKQCTIDQAGFETAMQQQQSRSKKATTRDIGPWQQVQESDEPCLFMGYDTMKATSHILKYRQITESGSTYYQIVLNQTPFYPQGGGQVGDRGWLCWKDEKIEVLDTKKEYQVIMHYTKRLPKQMTTPCTSQVDEQRRKAISRSHTTAHLLHAVLRQVLGKHVVQRGFYVDEKGFRIDFDQRKLISTETLQEITHRVNNKIRANIRLIEYRNMPMEEAKAMGAMALFTETYGKNVRVVCFDPQFSVELCGGTHVQATGEIGLFKLKKTSSVSAGIRRIEGLTGRGAMAYITQKEEKLNQIQQLLRDVQAPVKSLEKRLATHDKIHRQLKRLINVHDQSLLEQLKQKAATSEKHVLVCSLNLYDIASLRKIGTLLHKECPAVTLVLGTVVEKTPYLLIIVGTAHQEVHQANVLMNTLAPMMGGSGGGKARMAFAKGEQANRLAATLEAARNMLS